MNPTQMVQLACDAADRYCELRQLDPDRLINCSDGSGGQFTRQLSRREAIGRELLTRIYEYQALTQARGVESVKAVLQPDLRASDRQLLESLLETLHELVAHARAHRRAEEAHDLLTDCTNLESLLDRLRPWWPHE